MLFSHVSVLQSHLPLKRHLFLESRPPQERHLSLKAETSRQPLRRNKRKRAEMDSIETAILSSLRQEDAESDAEELFGLHVASVLWSLPPRQRAYAKMEIDRLLYTIQFPDMIPYGATGVGAQPPPHATAPLPPSSLTSQPANDCTSDSSSFY